MGSIISAEMKTCLPNSFIKGLLAKNKLTILKVYQKLVKSADVLKAPQPLLYFRIKKLVGSHFPVAMKIIPENNEEEGVFCPTKKKKHKRGAMIKFWKIKQLAMRMV